MPLEISEIGIRLAVGNGDQKPSMPIDKTNGQELTAEEREKLVEETAQKVLASLKAEQER